MKNLFDNPEASVLRGQMESLYEQEAKAVEFEIPAFADKIGKKIIEQNK